MPEYRDELGRPCPRESDRQLVYELLRTTEAQMRGSFSSAWCSGTPCLRFKRQESSQPGVERLKGQSRDEDSNKGAGHKTSNGSHKGSNVLTVSLEPGSI